MMKTFLPFFAILWLTASCIHARIWTNANGKSSFEAELIEYNAKTGKLTVDRDGKRITFYKPYYLILNLAIGGGWGGMKGIDDTAFPQRMEVDFVRVYQK